MYEIKLEDFMWGKPTARRYVKPDKVIYNDPATIVIWDDGTKTVVKSQGGEVYDEREGFLLCCAKRLMGNTGSYNDEMRGKVPDLHGAKFAISQVELVDR